MIPNGRNLELDFMTKPAGFFRVYLLRSAQGSRKRWFKLSTHLHLMSTISYDISELKGIIPFRKTMHGWNPLMLYIWVNHNSSATKNWLHCWENPPYSTSIYTGEEIYEVHRNTYRIIEIESFWTWITLSITSTKFHAVYSNPVAKNRNY